MSYKIGDLSKLLNIPVETIRFYEKMDILDSARTENGKYRVYESWDIFYLLEALQYRGFNFSLKESAYAVHHASLQQINNKLHEKKRELEEKVIFDNLLIQRIENKINRLITSRMNIGKFWVQHIPERYVYEYVESHEDLYEDIDLKKSLIAEWQRFSPFTTAFIHNDINDILNNVNAAKWGVSVNKEFGDILNLPINDDVQVFPQQVFLTTIIDAGPMGEFSLDALKPIISCAKRENYTITGDLYGELIVRMHENNSFSRLVELQLPIE